jgi:hypothetical protein
MEDFPPDTTYNEQFLGADDEFGTLARGPADDPEIAEAKERRDQIAEAIWNSYQAILHERGDIAALE